MRITNKLFLSGFIHSSLLNGSLSARLNNMVKMLEVQEERFGGPKGSSRRRASLNNKQEDQESLYTETEDDGELIPYGTYSGLSKNKDIQDHLINEHAAEHAKLVAKHETKQARIAAEYVADVGILSNDVESNTVDPQDQTVLSELPQPLGVEDRQAQSHLAQERRLDAATFLTRCESTSNLSGSNAYVDCVGGFVKDANGVITTQTCADACIVNGVSKCCPGGTGGCINFTGKVCRDGSCGNNVACLNANIGHVVGPSCTGYGSCIKATIGSVDLSCIEGSSCQGARIGSVVSSCSDGTSCLNADLSGVDLINSCNALGSCQSATNGNGVFDELIDCCNDDDYQCRSKDGLDIVNAGYPAPTSMPSESIVPSQSSAPSSSSEPSVEPSDSPSISQEPSEVPSAVPSESGEPSFVPSFVPSQSSEPSDEPSDSPSISVEPSVVPSAVPSESGKPSFVPSFVPSTSVEPSTEPSGSPSISQEPSTSQEPSEIPSAVPSESSKPSLAPSFVPSQSSEPSDEPSDSPSISQEPSQVPSTVPSESGKPSFVTSDSPSTSVEPSSSPTKSGKRSGNANFDKKGKGKSSKVDSSNMASKSDVLAYLSSNDLSSDEKKALISMLIIEILEHLAGDMNEMD